jgi:ATP-dependent DNA ligase
LLDSLNFNGPHWQTSPAFDDGEVLFAVAQENGLEGVVAKRLRSIYRPGERGSWVKVKNRAYWRYELEREAVARLVERRPIDSRRVSVV